MYICSVNPAKQKPAAGPPAVYRPNVKVGTPHVRANSIQQRGQATIQSSAMKAPPVYRPDLKIAVPLGLSKTVQKKSAIAQRSIAPPPFRPLTGTVQRQIAWNSKWPQHLFSTHGLSNQDFTTDEKLGNSLSTAKTQMKAVIMEAVNSNTDIKAAVEASGSEVDIYQESQDYPIKKFFTYERRGTLITTLLPDEGAEENAEYLASQKRIKDATAGLYLQVESGIHKSQTDSEPHITVQIWDKGARQSTYHLRLKFETTKKEWQLKSIFKMS